MKCHNRGLIKWNKYGEPDGGKIEVWKLYLFYIEIAVIGRYRSGYSMRFCLEAQDGIPFLGEFDTLKEAKDKSEQLFTEWLNKANLATASELQALRDKIKELEDDACEHNVKINAQQGSINSMVEVLADLERQKERLLDELLPHTKACK